MINKAMTIIIGIIVVICLAALIMYLAPKEAEAAITPTLCQGVISDTREKYEDFIDRVTVHPVSGEINSHFRCKWKLGVYRAQDALCDAPTFDKPDCSMYGRR